uniref:Coiled-coil domain containing 77 n=1 Tax=Xenopus tropicalis TaxID=8364 RepID=A0A6I8SPU9_XENTR
LSFNTTMSSSHTQKNRGDSTPLPPINERLAFLRPSRELLEYYRKKIAEFDEEHEDLVKQLEQYKATFEEQHRSSWEPRHREEDIMGAGRCWEEIEGGRLLIKIKNQPRFYLKLTFPLIRLQLQVTIPQRAVQSGDPYARKLQRSGQAGTKQAPLKAPGKQDRSKEGKKEDPQILLLQVEALQAQLEEQTRLSKEQIETLEDRKVRVEETQVQHQRDQDKMKSMTDKLNKTQKLLYESTRDFLQLKFECRANEKSWMAEKDRLLRELDRCREQLALSSDPEQEREHEREILRLSLVEKASRHSHSEESLTEQLAQAHRLAEMYREQCVTLEDELGKIREEGDVGREIFKERSDKVAKRLQLMAQRYEALEKRRNMEVEGYKTDIKLLRQRLKDVEKQLFKVTLNIGPDQDLAILDAVRQGNKKTQKIQGELRNLKAKICGLGNELRIG